jgi:hypothetical protein
MIPKSTPPKYVVGIQKVSPLKRLAVQVHVSFVSFAAIVAEAWELRETTS